MFIPFWAIPLAITLLCLWPICDVVFTVDRPAIPFVTAICLVPIGFSWAIYFGLCWALS